MAVERINWRMQLVAYKQNSRTEVGGEWSRGRERGQEETSRNVSHGRQCLSWTLQVEPSLAKDGGTYKETRIRHNEQTLCICVAVFHAGQCLIWANMQNLKMIKYLILLSDLGMLTRWGCERATQCRFVAVTDVLSLVHYSFPRT